MAKDSAKQQIDTGGGAYVGGSVTTGGDFVGRDKVTGYNDSQPNNTEFNQSASGPIHTGSGNIYVTNPPPVEAKAKLTPPFYPIAAIVMLIIVAGGAIWATMTFTGTAPLPPEPTTAQSTETLHVLDSGPENNSYYLEGAGATSFAVGDDLVVYAEPNPGTEVAVALLKVIAKNPQSLTAQAILIDPAVDIRTNMRVDDHLDFIAQSRLVPAFDQSVGYVLGARTVRLRPDHALTVGTRLAALQYTRVDELILDALPMQPPVEMRVTGIGASGLVATVELLQGRWPVTGTIVAVVGAATKSD